ncbi:MAG: DUF1566 domain-containing protein, partial [Flavobacterium sp.]|nr:DUF1566 domain-containing protein [Flavobacterium sp.]
DNLTQLIWQKVPNLSALSWENAIAYAESLSLASATDWRLPNLKELQSLNDESLTNPSANTTFFPTIGVHNYWSSTSVQNQPVNAGFWNTQFGITTLGLKTATNYVICVKGNPTNLAVKSIDLKSNICVFPNPFSSKINIENALGDEYFELYNQTGQIFFSGKNITQHDFSYLMSGVYFLKINKEKNYTIKIVKN